MYIHVYCIFRCTGVADHIMLYDKAGYSGNNRGPYTESVPSLGSFNNRMSSFIIEGCTAWRLCDRTYYTGFCGLAYIGSHYFTAVFTVNNQLRSVKSKFRIRL